MLHVFEGVEATSIKVIDGEVLDLGFKVVGLMSKRTSSISRSNRLEDGSTKYVAGVAGVNSLQHVQISSIVLRLWPSGKHFHTLFSVLVSWHHFRSAAAHLSS